MPPHVVCQVTLCREGPSTIFKRTLIRLLSTVYSHVGLQIPSLSEALLTALVIADERFFARVRPHVDFKSASPRVLLPTDVASVWLFS